MRESQNVFGWPVGGQSPRTERELWRQSNDWSHADCRAIMQRVGLKRKAAFIENILAVLPPDSRIHSATFGSAVNDEYRGELDAQQLTFESLLPTIAGPSGRKIVVLRLVDFCLRSLVCVSADRKLGEVFSTGWQSVFSAANWGRA